MRKSLTRTLVAAPIALLATLAFAAPGSAAQPDQVASRTATATAATVTPAPVHWGPQPSGVVWGVIWGVVWA